MPCLDDGWLQDDPGGDCDAVAAETESGGETAPETETATATESDSDGTCDNGVQDGDETDVDCGGSCPNQCGSGQGCDEDVDCVTMNCLPDNTCGDGTDGTCEDGVQNGDETDVDCGGACGPTCEIGEMCLDDGDCISDNCDTDAGVCADEDDDPDCDDGEQNGDETDVDCGGACGPTCDDGEMCLDDGDCISDNCLDDICTGTGGLHCVDADGDGFGDPKNCTMVPDGEEPPKGTVPNDEDCDDTLDTAFPGAAPNDSATECMEDKDDDDWGDDDPTGPGTTAGTDCDDDSLVGASTFPGAAPNDSATECMEDKDDDDWGDDDPGEPGVAVGTDCDDDSAAANQTFPGAAPNDDPLGCFEDKDDDDWGDDDPADPGADVGTDCDDDSAAAADVFPGAAPNDDATACMQDEDGDDWGDDSPTDGGTTAGTDCDDDSATTFPGSAEADSTTACMKDDDGDGWGDDTPGGGVTPGSDCDEDGEPPCCLLVTQDGTLDDTYDQGLEEVLDGLGYEITAVADTAADLADANGFTVVVISETALSTDIGGTYRDVLVPVVCLEGFVWDDMSMAPQGTSSTADDVDILDAVHPLAGGLMGTVEVISGTGAGQFHTTPPPSAVSVASVAGAPTEVSFFGSDQGDVMLPGFIAPRRRVGLGYDADQLAGDVTIEMDGQTLFEAAVVWATE